MTFKIEKGIKMPENKRRAVYPWDDMKVGDSFEFPAADHHKVGGCMRYREKIHNEKYAIRRMDGHTSRCWRLK